MTRSLAFDWGGRRHYSDENPGTLTANSAPTWLFLRHFDRHLQKFGKKWPKMTSSCWFFDKERNFEKGRHSEETGAAVSIDIKFTSRLPPAPSSNYWSIANEGTQWRGMDPGRAKKNGCTLQRENKTLRDQLYEIFFVRCKLCSSDSEFHNFVSNFPHSMWTGVSEVKDDQSLVMMQWASDRWRSDSMCLWQRTGGR